MSIGKKSKGSNREDPQLEDLLDGYSFDLEGWPGLRTRLEKLLQDNRLLREKANRLNLDFYRQGSLNASLNFRVYELEQVVGVLEKNLAGAQAEAGAWRMRVQYLKELAARLAIFAPIEARKRIEEELRQAIYLNEKSPPSASNE